MSARSFCFLGVAVVFVVVFAVAFAVVCIGVAASVLVEGSR